MIYAGIDTYVIVSALITKNPKNTHTNPRHGSVSGISFLCD